MVTLKIFRASQATLRKHALKKNKTLDPNTKGMGRYNSVFTDDMERELVNHIKLLETRLFGFTRQKVLKSAYQFAEVNKIPHNFNQITKMAGPGWLAGFRRRNPNISLRSRSRSNFCCESRSYFCCESPSLQQTASSTFFNTYPDIVESNKILPHKLYRMWMSQLYQLFKDPKSCLQLRVESRMGP
ncbi:hypothetical protein JTB14_033513 [Gonioctena quinquepunctata]|nr:hypothetical protein JTB14_033513 [Gonioctena quinquepunctata]